MLVWGFPRLHVPCITSFRWHIWFCFGFFIFFFWLSTQCANLSMFSDLCTKYVPRLWILFLIGLVYDKMPTLYILTGVFEALRRIFRFWTRVSSVFFFMSDPVSGWSHVCETLHWTRESSTVAALPLWGDAQCHLFKSSETDACGF